MSGPGPGQEDPFRQLLRRALAWVLVFVTVLTVAGSGVGALVADLRGLWGGLIGGGVVAVVTATTVVLMLMTARAPLSTSAALAMAAWVLKVVLLFGALLALQGSDLVHRPTFGVVVVVGVLGSLVIDYWAVARSRVPYVDPSERR